MFVKRLLKGSEGFTLVEMTVVIAIIAVLAALTLPAVTGVTTSTRSASKAGDLKEVEQAVTRYESDNPATLPSAATLLSVATHVADANADGNIDINIYIDGTDSPDATPRENICAAATAALALNACFGEILFSSLAPDFLKLAPAYSTTADFVTDSLVTTGTINGVTSGSDNGFDFEVANCDLTGNTCRFSLGATTNLTGVLQVWNVLSTLDASNAAAVGGVMAFVDDAKYGTN